MVSNATFKQYFSYIVVVSFIGENRRKQLTCRKSLTNFITWKKKRFQSPATRFIPLQSIVMENLYPLIFLKTN